MNKLPQQNSNRRLTFGKEKHLLKRWQFLEIQSTEAVFRSPFFIILKKTNDLGHARFGFTISKKISKKAVIRNRIRRWLKEAVRIHQHKFENADFVFIPRKRIIDSNFHSIESYILKYLTKQKG